MDDSTQSTELGGSRWGLVRNLLLEHSSQLRHKQYNAVRFKLPPEKLQAAERKKQYGEVVPFSMLDEMLISACMPKTKAWVKQQVREGRYVFFPVCFCDILLRGVSQVYLIDHPVAGLFIVAAVSLTKTIYIYAALLGTLASTLGAIYGLRGFTDSIFDGLYGYDGCLVGMAVFTFFYEAGDVWQMTLTTLALGFFAGIFQVALVFMLKRLKVPALTVSFNLVTIMFLGSTSSKINAVATLRSGGPASTPIEGPPLFTVVLEGTLKGVGQFMFADTMVGGLLIFLAIMMCKRVDSAGALLGSFVATATAAYIHRVSPGIMRSVQDGLWSYNGMGCGAAFASGLFTHPTPYNFVFGMTSAALSVLVMGAWVAWLGSLPVLTFPFVTTVIVTLMARHHGEEVRAGAVPSGPPAENPIPKRPGASQLGGSQRLETSQLASSKRPTAHHVGDGSRTDSSQVRGNLRPESVQRFRAMFAESSNMSRATSGLGGSHLVASHLLGSHLRSSLLGGSHHLDGSLPGRASPQPLPQLVEFSYHPETMDGCTRPGTEEGGTRPGTEEGGTRPGTQEHPQVQAPFEATDTNEFFTPVTP